MNLNEWIINSKKNLNTAVSINKDEFVLKNLHNSYSLLYLSYDFGKMKELSVYKFDYDVISNGINYKIICNWKDKNSKSLLREYIDNKSEVVSPKCADNLTIEFIAIGYKKGELEFKKLKCDYLREHKPKKVTMAAVHIDTIQDFPTTCEENLNKAIIGIDNISREKPDIVVLSECFYDRRTNLSIKDGALSINSEPIRLLRRKAKEHKFYLAFAFREIKENYYYNTGILINRKGEIEGLYRKTHLTFSEIKSGLIPGDEVKVFETEIGKIAFAICWDMWFPELIAEYYKKGVEILINPTAGFPDLQTRVRAIDNSLYIITAGLMDRTKTRIINPEGEVIADATVNGYAVKTVDLTKRHIEYWLSVGSTFGEWKNIYKNEIRPDLYTKWE